MKLISCYIENFGNIRQRSFDFKEGLTSYCEHNGYGKTTLASFLKAMFYGLKQTRANDKELGERARFYPFEGGKFGGNVTFEKDGVTYKIERFFGEKSATQDNTTVYANDVIISAEDLGKEFFGMDEQSFLRTVFLNSSDTESGATGDISRMLNGFVDDADFEGAKKILEKQQKEYKAGRGRGGKIDEKHDAVLRLKENIENKEKINGELNRKYEERKVLADTVAQLEERGSSFRDRNLVLQKWDTYDGFVSDAEGERKKLALIEEKYPAGLPEEEEIKELKQHSEGLNLANERRASASFPTDKAIRLEELSARFKQGTPTEEDISSVNGTVAELIRLDAEIANLQGLTKGSTESKFAVRVPENDEVKRYGEKVALLRDKRSKPANSGSSGKKIALFAAVLAVMALGGGGALMYLKYLMYGGILLGVGAVLAFAGIFAYFKGQINNMSAVTSKEITELETDIRGFLARFGYYSDGGVDVDYNNLARDYEIYNSNKEEREKNEQLLAQKREDAEAAKSKVLTFLRRYGFSGENTQSDLTRLGVLVAEYAALNEEKEGFSARFEASGAEIEKLTQSVNEILEKYSIGQNKNLGGLLAEIERDRAEYERLEDNVKRLEKKASDYREENGLDERPDEGDEDVRGIDAELSKKRDELSLLDREISDDEGAVERLAELKEELDNALEEESLLKRKHTLIVKTLELLERAESNLKDKYISPVKNSFLNYSNLLESVLGEKVTFDKDFKVKFERGGENRSDAHLSSGQKSLCALCLRLALIDNMYKVEKPFIIMDDPFVHLDGEHMVRAEALLKALSKDRQIIYFCCHESRKI